MYKGKKSYGELVVTSSDSAIAFEFLKETFDVMVFFVKWNNDFAIATGFNASSSAKRGDFLSDFVRIISLISLISLISHNYFGF